MTKADERVRMDDAGSLGAELVDPDLQMSSQADLIGRAANYRAWRKTRHDAYSLDKGAEIRSPLILQGMVRVTGTFGGTSTGAIVHSEWTQQVGYWEVEEQWLIFDEEGSELDMTFASKTGGQPYARSVLPEPYGARLPWPRRDHASGPVPTYWYPISDGADVSTQGFFDGIKAAPGKRAHRYVATKLRVQEYAWPARPTALSEHVPDEEASGRGWEEDFARGALTPAEARGWVYGEWETDDLPPTVGIHMAWGAGYKSPPDESAMTAARTPLKRLDLQGWFTKLATRLKLSDGSNGSPASTYLYAFGRAALYPSVPANKP